MPTPDGPDMISGLRRASRLGIWVLEEKERELLPDPVLLLGIAVRSGSTRLLLMLLVDDGRG